MRKGLVCLFVLLTLICSAPGWSAELRGIWVDGFHSGFKNTGEVDQLLADVRACHANAVFVEMRVRGNTYYPSPYEPHSSFDAMAYLIQKAHGGTPRIEVHFWSPVTLVASGLPSDPDHIINRHPEYESKDNAGSSTFDGNYYLDPGHPDAEQFLYNVFMDVVNRYDVDGIHFDYVRFPSETFGYNEASINRFNTAFLRTGTPTYDDGQWCSWRRLQITNFVRKVYVNAIAAKPNIKVSAATVTWSPAATSDTDWSKSAAFSSVFQDWRAWMEEGIIDLNIPMNYFDALDKYASNYYTWLNFTLDHQYNRTSATGPGIYMNTIANSITQIRATRNTSPGGHTGMGASLYCYASTNSEGYSNSTFMNALVNPTSFDPNPTPVWQNVTTVPIMPWKASPTKGHIKGTVTLASTMPLDYARVTLSNGKEIRTDGTGFYAFIDVIPGTYTLTAEKSGYGTVTRSVTVTAGHVATADMDLGVGSMTISNITVNNETANSVTVKWSTNVAGTSQVAYGLDKSCANLTTEDTTQVASHSVIINGLNPQTPYYFRVISRNPTIPTAISDVYAFVTGVNIPEIIIDDPQAQFSGSWSTSSSSYDKYGPSYRYCTTVGSVVNTATYTPDLPVAGNYDVYTWYPAGGNRCTASQFTIYYDGGTQLCIVNQQNNGGKWNLLGTKPLAANAGNCVQITNQSTVTGFNVIADAVRFVYKPESQVPTTPAGLQAQAAANDRVALIWSTSADASGVGGYRIYRNNMVVGATSATSFTDTGLIANSRYTYNVEAYDIWGNRSGKSTTATVYTFSMPPSAETVQCNKPIGLWQTENVFTFTMVGGTGPGHVAYYSYSWDNLPTHIWDGGEWTWAAGTIDLEAVSGPAPYYLHVKGYNVQGLPNGTLDLGPYYLDTTAPPAPAVTDDGQYNNSRTQIHASWIADDPDSGIAAYQYAVGTTSGGTDIVGWTDPDANEATIDIPEQAPGTVLYVSVKARNGAGTWGSTGVSDGITVGNSVTSIAAARALADNALVSLTGVKISAIFADCFYVQDGSRTGIRIDGPTTLTEGSTVTIHGVMDKLHGERKITTAKVVSGS